MIKNNFFKIMTGLLLILSVFANQNVFATPLQSAAKNYLHSHSNVNFLFIQVASSGELVPTSNPACYKLILKGVDSFTSYFTDRPNRVTGLLSTNQFVTIWNNRDDIKASPPNVAMETSNLQNGHKINRVVMLTDPVYDAAKHELTYTATLIDKKFKPINKLALGYTVLFIDDFHWGGAVG